MKMDETSFLYQFDNSSMINEQTNSIYRSDDTDVVIHFKFEMRFLLIEASESRILWNDCDRMPIYLHTTIINT